MSEAGETITDKDIITEILEEYRELPCLWDPQDVLYRNKDARQQAFEELARMWRKIDTFATKQKVRKKLENMRSTFMKEYKKVQISKMQGGRVYRPTLWYYKQLMFLSEIEHPIPQVPAKSLTPIVSLNPVTSTNTINSTDSINSTNSVNSMNPEITVKQSLTPAKCMTPDPLRGVSDDEEPATEKEKETRGVKRKYTDIYKRQEDLLDSVQNLLSESNDDCDTFGQYIAPQLREMSKVQRCIAEKLISEIVFYGKMDQLSLNSSISLNQFVVPNSRSPSPQDSKLDFCS